MNKPDYSNSIVNFSNSILKHYGVKPFHSTIKEIDTLLKGKTKIVVFLFDGMGHDTLERCLPETSFLRKHVVHQMTATFPPTTVASTNGMLSGRFPIETGWLGWSQYFKKLDKNIDVFKNTDSQNGLLVGVDSVMEKVASYKNIVDLINDKFGKPIATQMMGFPVDRVNFYSRYLTWFIKKAYQFAQQDEIDEQSFVYAYWTKPDEIMHPLGVDHKCVVKYVRKINKYIEKYSKRNPKVATFVIADHGLVNVDFHDIHEHPDLADMLRQPFSFEKRCINLFVKKENISEFKNLFLKYYGEHYEIYTTQEALDMQLFGAATPSKLALGFLGDFIAVATDNFTLAEDSKKSIFKAHHAGSTLAEFNIDIVGTNL